MATHKRRSRGGNNAKGPVQALTKPPFPCVNCGSLMQGATLYCSELCSQEAEWVRYTRRSFRDGRARLLEVAYAIRVRRAHILAGGYPAHARRLPGCVRKAVFARDEGKCRACGQPGAEIDHISGDGDDLDNLQLLCAVCHRKKTLSSMIRISKESHPAAWQKAEELSRRVRVKRPLRLCDSEEWNEIWRDILTERKRQAAISG